MMTTNAPTETTHRPPSRPRGRPPSTQDNATVAALLNGFLNAGEACRAMPWLDDVLSGVLELRTEGDTGTRPLRRTILFLVLQRCQRISTDELKGVLGHRYCHRSIERYAACARVASKAIKSQPAEALVTASDTSDRDARRELDAPWMADAARAEAESLAAGPAPTHHDPFKVAANAGDASSNGRLRCARLALLVMPE